MGSRRARRGDGAPGLRISDAAGRPPRTAFRPSWPHPRCGDRRRSGRRTGAHYPFALLSDLLRQHGWEVSDLGADVPDESFVHTVLATPDVVAVGISVMTEAGLASAARALAALRAAADGDPRRRRPGHDQRRGRPRSRRPPRGRRCERLAALLDAREVDRTSPRTSSVSMN